MSVTNLEERASAVQRELSDNIQQFRPRKARTLATFEQGRRKQAGLAGLQMAYWTDHAHGQSYPNPVAGDFSFKPGTKQKTRAMFAGTVMLNMNFPIEETIQRDMRNGFIPDSYLEERKRRVETHMMKKNRDAIGDGTGSLAAVSGASGTTITCLANNSARGTSKGVYFLDVSEAADPLLYDAVDPADDTVKATFYITAKPSTTTATAVFTFGNAAAMNDNTFKICESGSWKKHITGIAGHISDSTSRIYQGADVAVDPSLGNKAIDAGNAVVTPTAMHSAKGLMMTRGNASEDDFMYVCHLTWKNYRDLAKFGYTARSYDAATSPKGAMKTLALPNLYEDGDTVFVCDADYEEGYIDLREKRTFFEYVQKDFGLQSIGGVSRREWAGDYDAGSTLSHENYNEVCNIVWDGKGANGKGKEGGSPNTSVFIKNIAVSSTESQYAVGV